MRISLKYIEQMLYNLSYVSPADFAGILCRHKFFNENFIKLLGKKKSPRRAMD